MTANSKSADRAFVDLDEAPDLSTPDWVAKFASVPVVRGRPRAEKPKVSTTLRLDADVMAQFRAGGRGWQSRINAALREFLEKDPA